MHESNNKNEFHVRYWNLWKERRCIPRRMAHNCRGNKVDLIERRSAFLRHSNAYSRDATGNFCSFSSSFSSSTAIRRRLQTLPIPIRDASVPRFNFHPFHFPTRSSPLENSYSRVHVEMSLYYYFFVPTSFSSRTENKICRWRQHETRLANKILVARNWAALQFSFFFLYFALISSAYTPRADASRLFCATRNLVSL